MICQCGRLNFLVPTSSDSELSSDKTFSALTFRQHLILRLCWEEADLIFVIFSPLRKFLDIFFSTQKWLNCDKTDFATKCVNCGKTDFTTNSINFPYAATFSTLNTCQMWRNSDFSTFVMWRNLKFLHMWRNF